MPSVRAKKGIARARNRCRPLCLCLCFGLEVIGSAHKALDVQLRIHRRGLLLMVDIPSFDATYLAVIESVYLMVKEFLMFSISKISD